MFCSRSLSCLGVKIIFFSISFYPQEKPVPRCLWVWLTAPGNRNQSFWICPTAAPRVPKSLERKLQSSGKQQPRFAVAFSPQSVFINYPVVPRCHLANSYEYYLCISSQVAYEFHPDVTYVNWEIHVYFFAFNMFNTDIWRLGGTSKEKFSMIYIM